MVSSGSLDASSGTSDRKERAHDLLSSIYKRISESLITTGSLPRIGSGYARACFPCVGPYVVVDPGTHLRHIILPRTKPARTWRALIGEVALNFFSKYTASGSYRSSVADHAPSDEHPDQSDQPTGQLLMKRPTGACDLYPDYENYLGVLKGWRIIRRILR